MVLFQQMMLWKTTPLAVFFFWRDVIKHIDVLLYFRFLICVCVFVFCIHMHLYIVYKLSL